jgi:hypothetical protein
MALPRYVKHPNEIRGYPIIVNGLGLNTITASSTTITPAGMTEVSTTFSGAEVTALLSGGAANTDYQAETQIDLSNGERLIQEYIIQVRNP